MISVNELNKKSVRHTMLCLSACVSGLAIGQPAKADGSDVAPIISIGNAKAHPPMTPKSDVPIIKSHSLTPWSSINVGGNYPYVSLWDQGNDPTAYNAGTTAKPVVINQAFFYMPPASTRADKAVDSFTLNSMTARVFLSVPHPHKVPEYTWQVNAPFTIIDGNGGTYFGTSKIGIEAVLPLPKLALGNLSAYNYFATYVTVKYYNETFTYTIRWHLPMEHFALNPAIVNPNHRGINGQRSGHHDTWLYDVEPALPGVDDDISYVGIEYQKWIPETLENIHAATLALPAVAELAKWELVPEFAALSEILGVGALVLGTDISKRREPQHFNLNNCFDRGLITDNAHGTVKLQKNYGCRYFPMPTTPTLEGNQQHYIPDRGKYEAHYLASRVDTLDDYLIYDKYTAKGFVSQGAPFKLPPIQQATSTHRVIADWVEKGFPGTVLPRPPGMWNSTPQPTPKPPAGTTYEGGDTGGE